MRPAVRSVVGSPVVGAAVFAAVLIAAGCVRSAYQPPEDPERLTVEAATDRLDIEVEKECPRLRAAERESGVAEFLLELHASGDVSRSRLRLSSGDRRMDDIFGAVTARMQFVPPADAGGQPYEGRIRAGFSCAANTASSTLELL